MRKKYLNISTNYVIIKRKRVERLFMYKEEKNGREISQTDSKNKGREKDR